MFCVTFPPLHPGELGDSLAESYPCPFLSMPLPVWTLIKTRLSWRTSPLPPSQVLSSVLFPHWACTQVSELLGPLLLRQHPSVQPSSLQCHHYVGSLSIPPNLVHTLAQPCSWGETLDLMCSQQTPPSSQLHVSCFPITNDPFPAHSLLRHDSQIKSFSTAPSIH